MPLSTELLNGMFALIGVVILVAGMLSGLVERSNVPQVGIFLLLGAALGDHGFKLLNVGLDSPVLRVVATLSLALVLFTDALGLRLSEIKRHSGLAGAILGPGTLLAAAIIFGAGVYLLHLPWPMALILAAALASTDPVILRGLLRRPGLPSNAKLALRLESGLNDVVLLPLVLIGIAFAGHGEGSHVNPGELLLRMLVIGPLTGLVLALVAIGALEKVRRRIGVRRDYESLYSIGICLTSYAAAEALHTSGFLAAFAAGIAVSAQDVDLCDCFQEYGETTAEMLLMFTFVLLGASLIWSGFALASVMLLAFVVVALFARPFSLYLTLAPMKMEAVSRRIIAWFGPRGLSTLLLALLPAFEGLPGSAMLFQVASVIVVASVVIHGASIMAFRGQPQPSVVTDVPAGWTPEQLKAALAREKVRLIDVRSAKSYGESSLDLLGAYRIDPERPVETLFDLGLDKAASLALFCTCPAEETSGRAVQVLKEAGWEAAAPVIGGWDALLAAGFLTVRRH